MPNVLWMWMLHQIKKSREWRWPHTYDRGAWTSTLITFAWHYPERGESSSRWCGSVILSFQTIRDGTDLGKFTSNALRNQGFATHTKFKYLSDIPLLEVEQPYELFVHQLQLRGIFFREFSSGEILDWGYSVVETSPSKILGKSSSSTEYIWQASHPWNMPLVASWVQTTSNLLAAIRILSERVVQCSGEIMDLVKRQLCAIKVVCFDRGLISFRTV